MPAIQLSPDTSAELTRLSALLRSPFEPFQRLKTESVNLESIAWNTMGVWHQTGPECIDYGLACAKEVEAVLSEIASAYDLPTIEAALQITVYLGYRARFMNHEHAIWEGGPCWSIECQYDQYADGDGAQPPSYFGLAYPTAPAPLGDLVGIPKIDQASFTPDPLFPIDGFWGVLEADHEVPSGLVSYEAAYREARKALALHLSQLRHQVEPSLGVQHLRKVVQEIQEKPDDMLLWAALLIHALLLGAM